MDPMDCLTKNGTHDNKPVSEWARLTDPTGEPINEGQYRTLECKRCNAETIEAKALEK